MHVVDGFESIQVNIGQAYMIAATLGLAEGQAQTFKQHPAIGKQCQMVNLR